MEVVVMERTSIETMSTCGIKEVHQAIPATKHIWDGKLVPSLKLKTFQNYLAKIKGNLKFYQNLHSYSQMIMLPWGFSEENCPNHDKMMTLAKKVCSYFKHWG